MELQKVLVGSIVALSSGAARDNRRGVEFKAELLAENRQFGTNKGQPTDTRGSVQRLYKLFDGRMAIHLEVWSNWTGEPSIHTLRVVTLADLQSEFWQLADLAGLGKPLSFDEATAEPTDADRLAGGDVVDCVICDGLVEPGDNHDTSPEGAVVCAACM